MTNHQNKRVTTHNNGVTPGYETIPHRLDSSGDRSGFLLVYPGGEPIRIIRVTCTSHRLDSFAYVAAGLVDSHIINNLIYIAYIIIHGDLTVLKH